MTEPSLNDESSLLSEAPCPHRLPNQRLALPTNMGMTTKRSDLAVYGSSHRLSLSQSTLWWWKLRRPRGKRLASILLFGSLIFLQFIISSSKSDSLSTKSWLLLLGLTVVVALLFVRIYDGRQTDRFGSRPGLALDLLHWSDLCPVEDDSISQVLFSQSDWIESSSGGATLRSGTHTGLHFAVSPLRKRIRMVEIGESRWAAREVLR